MDTKNITSMTKSQQLFEISRLLDDAKNYNLLAEVVATAMDYHRKSPNSIPLQSIIIGHSEWIK